MLPAERSSASSELAATRLSTVIGAALALKGKRQASQKKIDRRFMDPLPLPAVVQAWVRGAPVQVRNGFTVISPPGRGVAWVSEHLCRSGVEAMSWLHLGKPS